MYICTIDANVVGQAFEVAYQAVVRIQGGGGGGGTQSTSGTQVSHCLHGFSR